MSLSLWDEVIQYFWVSIPKAFGPPPSIHPVPPFDFTGFLMTMMILLFLGTIVTWAHCAILAGHKNL